MDHHRQIRSGFGEVVFCSGKSDEHLLKIYETFYKTDTEVLGTRASEHQYELVKAVIPEVTYDPLSRILKIEKPGKERIGRVAVCTAGTADIAVAEEAAQVAEYFGTNVDRFYDVGVAGDSSFICQTGRNSQSQLYYCCCRYGGSTWRCSGGPC